MFNLWHGLSAVAEALVKDCYYLPLLLLGLWGISRTVRKNHALAFLITALAVAFCWRVRYAMSQGIAERYIQLVALLSMVLLGGCAVRLADILTQYASRRNISIRPNAVMAAILLLILAMGAGRALNPPEQKKYIADMAMALREQMPKDAVLLDCSGESVRLSTMLEGRKIISMKYPYQDASFWTVFLSELQSEQFQALDLWTVIRTPVALPPEQFEQDFRALWHFFPFEGKNSFLSRRYRYTVYRFNFQTGSYKTPHVTSMSKNPLGMRLPLEIAVPPGDQATITFSAMFPRPEATLPGIYFSVHAPQRGWTEQTKWCYRAAASGQSAFPVTITAYNALGWPVGCVRTDIRAGAGPGHRLQAPLADVAAPPGLADSVSNRTPGALLPLPARFSLPASRPIIWENLRGLAAEGEWKFSEERNHGKIKGTAVHCTGNREQYDITVTPPAPAAAWNGRKEQNCIWIGTREITSPQLFEALKAKARENGVTLNFISTLAPRAHEFMDRPSWRILNLSENNIFFHGAEFDFENYRKRNAFPQIDVVILALGDEELLLSNQYFMPSQRTLPEDIRHVLSALRQQWPHARIIIVLPPVPPRNQDSFAAMSNSEYLFPFSWNKVLNHARYVKTVLENANPDEVGIIPLYLFWDETADWDRCFSDLLQKEIVSGSIRSDSGIRKAADFIFNEISIPNAKRQNGL